MIERIDRAVIMNAEDLATEVTRLRKLKGYSQEEVANMLVEKKLYESVSKQLVSRAENPRVTTGDSLHKLRVKIIEMLGGKKVRGPVWIVEEQTQS